MKDMPSGLYLVYGLDKSEPISNSIHDLLNSTVCANYEDAVARAGYYVRRGHCDEVYISRLMPSEKVTQAPPMKVSLP